MKKNICTFIVISIICIANNLFCQDLGACYFNYNPEYNRLELERGYESNTWLNKYRTPGYWIPNDSTPIKTILVNWIICRDNNGQNGWQDNTEFRKQVDSMFVRINEYYSNSLSRVYDLTCEPEYTHIYDSRIRFELNDIIFLNNTTFNQCSLLSTSGIQDILDYLYINYPSSKTALNHIFSQPNNPPAGIWGRSDIYNDYAFVITNRSMWDSTKVVWNDHVSHITHEYGHIVGLNHTYDGEYTCTSHYDFLNDVFGECAENIVPCNHYSLTCDDEQVCYLDKTWFEEYELHYPLMSGTMDATNRYISPKSMGRMHRDLSLYDHNFASCSSNTHRFVKERHSYSIPKVINSDETWDFKIKMYQDIIVDNNATLTITGEVRMPIYGKIIVKPGAKLIVDGGTLTTAYDSLWQGIQVWGDTSAPQTATNGVYQQGYVELKNGATIENAVCALDLWKPDDYTKTGGIVVATDANFINNARTVRAMNYIYSSNNTEVNYNARFTRCNFEINSEYLGTETFIKHVGLCGVRGVVFSGCTFSVDNTAYNISNYTIGIQVTDAHVMVSSYCNSRDVRPCNNIIPSTFTGFYEAVYAVHSTYTQRPFYITGCEFYNNIFGVYSINTGYAQIANNTFYVPSKSICTYGAYLESMASFNVNGNDFIGIGQNYENCGVSVKNSPYNNNVLQNDFSNLAFGTESIGKNYNVSLSLPIVISSLSYTCNDNTGNMLADFYAINDGSSIGSVYSMGSPSLSAGNTFSSTAIQQISNLTTETFTYYYDTLYPGRVPTSIYGVILYKAGAANNCGTRDSGTNSKSPLWDYEEAEKICNRIRVELEAETDPNNIKVLEAELAFANHQLLTIIDNAVKEILMDSVSSINDVRQWLNRAKTPSADRAICATYLSQRYYETAINKAMAMIDDYQMQGDALIEQTEYIEILRLQQKVESDGRVMQQLNDDELRQVHRLYDYGTGVAKSIAKALLQMNGNFFECDCDNELITRGNIETTSDAISETEESETYFFSVSPVPAKDYVIVNYNLPADHATLFLTNNLGINIKTVKIDGTKGKKIVSLSDLTAGVYSCTINCEGFIKTEKIIVVTK